ncbi:transcriptional repressor [Candidatus Woesebacteria bacterium]|nr:transcriptional repressor [Candidatus Woesebacteria bacterium]
MISSVQKKLKQKGYRITQSRLSILSEIESHPLTAAEIHQKLTKRHIRIDLASVYRTLELLASMGEVETVHIGDGSLRFERSNAHHHHLICDTCGSIGDITIHEDVFIKEVAQKSRFQVKKHSLEFFGLCVNCQ